MKLLKLKWFPIFKNKILPFTCNVNSIWTSKYHFLFDSYAPRLINRSHNKDLLATIQILSLNLSSKICFFLDFLKILLKKELKKYVKTVLF